MIRVASSDVKAALRQQAGAGPLRLERSEALARLGSERFDILIIGGGITGAYAAFDAALRGHKVALVEKGDFASGTSSKSSKMIHGGLRYLQQANVRLVAH
ncbi:FAD-dependent oxidoreductase, partial [Propionibacterium freudenreichii]|nr:FAD-dependent oxidoreductase [Propionibacterium freudenreichii]